VQELIRKKIENSWQKNEFTFYLFPQKTNIHCLPRRPIIEFEKKYPESDMLCELLPIHIAWRKDRGYTTEEIEKRYKKKCK